MTTDDLTDVYASWGEVVQAVRDAADAVRTERTEAREALPEALPVEEVAPTTDPPAETPVESAAHGPPNAGFGSPSASESLPPVGDRS